MNKKLIVSIALIASTAILSADNVKKADTNTTKSKVSSSAKELFKVMEFDKVNKIIVSNATNNTLRQNPKFKSVEGKIKSFFEKYVGWKVIEPRMAKLYSKYYTDDELKKLIEFYKTPLGKKTLKVTPKLSLDGQKLINSSLQEHRKELVDMLKKTLESNTTKTK